jgi:hypothetical protein
MPLLDDAITDVSCRIVSNQATGAPTRDVKYKPADANQESFVDNQRVNNTIS